ncbi:uncharacterized protein BP5553_00638 [Venustampulla echinocandica]|uniref:Uncharacterized protein n=1 Tax=Venustampulla echinocandica TaxID=2656787 RepID=A0A370TYQ0_9HELO|nr:uncharacterized protein BP5553_00638 [Venustampulla echinocandica]RDL40659.1 hypothetical protein BP5553_00638 [Venustampulla echinocandica]
MASIGPNLRQLLPTAGTWAAPFTIYYVLLCARVVYQRIKHRVPLGQNITYSKKDKPSDSAPAHPVDDPLEVAIRCQGNFQENVPLAYALLVVCELNGGDKKYLNYVAGFLFAARVAHADFGLMKKGRHAGNGVGRPLGFLGSTVVLLGLSVYSGWLIKGYWGF